MFIFYLFFKKELSPPSFSDECIGLKIEALSIIKTLKASYENHKNEGTVLFGGVGMES